MVDALASGASRGNPVEVQVLSSAPYKGFKNLQKDRKPWAYKALRVFLCPSEFVEIPWHTPKTTIACRLLTAS